MAQTHAGAEKTAAKRAGLTLEQFLAKKAASLKRCIKCQSWVHTSGFGKDISRFDGLTSTCTECRSARRKTSGPGKRERQSRRKAGAAWCRRCAAWLPATEIHSGLCREHTRQEYRALYARNPAPFKARSAARKSGVKHPTKAWGETILALFDGRCAYCRRPASTWDHVQPVSKGGLSISCNFVPACQPCNASKGNRDVWAWAPGRDLHPAFEERLIMSERI